MPNDVDFTALEAVLGHTFSKRHFLVMALTHRSFANENVDLTQPDNEKLEFLGDAVLDLIVGHMLMETFPSLHEGQLSVTRAQVVSEAGLSDLALELDLGSWLYLGKGEAKSGGRHKPSILADAVEAVVAAVYLDAGFAAAWALVERLFSARIQNVEASGFYDFKTRLQELAQERLRATPVYRVVGESGPDHAKVFHVCVEIRGHVWGSAGGRSKKEAEQRAAAAAAFTLEGADLATLASAGLEPKE